MHYTRFLCWCFPLLSLFCGLQAEVLSQPELETRHNAVAESIQANGTRYDPPQGVWKESWYTFKINGQKVGYVQIVLEREGNLIRTRSKQYLRMGRLENVVESRVDELTEETINGEPLRFSILQEMGVTPILTEGVIEGETLKLSTDQYGQAVEREVQWPTGALMSWGTSLFLKDMVLEVGASREMLAFVPSVSVDKGVPCSMHIEARETIEWGGDKLEVWRVRQVLNISASASMEIVMWMDNEDNLYRTLVEIGPLMKMEMEKTSSEEALADFVGTDLFEQSLLWIPGSYGANEASVAIYEVSVDEGTLVDLFPETTDQTVEQLNSATLKIRVAPQHLNPEDMRIQGGPDPDPEYLEANFNLNYEDEEVKKLLEELEPLRELSRIERARELTVWVSDFIDNKNYDIGFATAAEVARNREGDCTEHAVLLAALGRALDLPSRVAYGLVLLPADDPESEGLMGFHMWTQFYFEGQWFDYDAALAPHNTPPTRLFMGSSSLKSDTLYEMGMHVGRLIGSLEVQVVELSYKQADNGGE